MYQSRPYWIWLTPLLMLISLWLIPLIPLPSSSAAPADRTQVEEPRTWADEDVALSPSFDSNY